MTYFQTLLRIAMICSAWITLTRTVVGIGAELGDRKFESNRQTLPQPLSFLFRARMPAFMGLFQFLYSLLWARMFLYSNLPFSLLRGLVIFSYKALYAIPGLFFFLFLFFKRTEISSSLFGSWGFLWVTIHSAGADLCCLYQNCGVKLRNGPGNAPIAPGLIGNLSLWYEW